MKPLSLLCVPFVLLCIGEKSTQCQNGKDYVIWFWLFSLLVLFCEAGSHIVAQSGLKLEAILLPHPPRYSGMRLQTSQFILFATKHVWSRSCSNTHEKICTGEEEGLKVTGKILSTRKLSLETISRPSLPVSSFSFRPSHSK